MQQTFKKLLVANRGEIAIRILRACTEMGIRTVAIYTWEDRYSLHRYKADEAYQVGAENDPLKPYLAIEEIILIAKQNGVDAIHPGYGFLSENVNFARRCREEGITFVGPSPEVMEQLGDKIRAKKVAIAAKVPIIESNKKKLTSAKIAVAEANEIGYPVMMKAAAGGGGRGMRVCRNDEQVKKSFIESRREAQNAFGDDTIFLEKFVEDPKHIEVQIIGDNEGNLVHLYERDCSVQRRFQKIVELAPAPNLPEKTRKLLHKYALKICKKVNYNNAGTVEFLVDKDNNIYFIEVNPRIQVEHTVTEEITGIDIVYTQICIAAGIPLSESDNLYSQSAISCNGFAVQCRITTEDPLNNFKPDYGRIIAYRNAGGYGIRIDEGSTYPGMQISPFFDSMLCKVTAWGRDLEDASKRLNRTLAEYRIRGVKDNTRFLQNILEHPVFRAGDARVSFIEKNPDVFEYKKRRDRATKALRFLANVSVNGNSDVDPELINEKKVFRTPKVPQFDRFAEHTKGTKQLLHELGADGFSKWLKKQKQVQITDTTFRDAHQSLLATRVRTRDLLAVAESYAKNHPQTFSMEVWGGATFDVAMRFLKECPWKRLDLLREAMPNVLLQMLLRGSNAIGYTAYPDNLIEKFIEQSWNDGKGVDIFRIFDSLNWVENMKVSIKTVRERTGGLAEACLCYSGDILDETKTKYTLQYYLDLAKQLEDAGAHILAIKDMAGLLKPYAAEKLVTELKKSVDLPIHLHSHDTSAAQLATYMKAVEAGVDVVDVALSSMSGLTSQPNFNTLMAMLKGTKRDPKFDVNSLGEFSNYWEAIREYYYPFESGLMAGTADVYEHEIPGGQYSNLKRQARSMGLADRMPEVAKTYATVNQMFGNLVKVTPSSKVVGDLALYMVTNNLSENDVYERGDAIDFPQSTKSFFRGELGQPYGGFPKKLQKIVLRDEKPFTERANVHLEQVDFDKEFTEFQTEFEELNTFRDFLSYKFYPKVFRNYQQHYTLYGDVSILPTKEFLFGMKQNEEAVYSIEEGKNIIVQLVYISEPKEDGFRFVTFKLNGQDRTLKVKDLHVQTEDRSHRKADATDESEIGSPLQGLLSKIFVKKGEKVEKNQPLFVIEAMKMETTVTAPAAGEISSIELAEGVMVEAEDLVILL